MGSRTHAHNVYPAYTEIEKLIDNLWCPAPVWNCAGDFKLQRLEKIF